MRKVLRKHCVYCKNQFMTYDQDKSYCNHTCEAREKYDDHFGIEKPKENNYPCQQCGISIKAAGKKFCCNGCSNQYHKINSRDKYDLEKKEDKTKVKRPSFEYLNKIEEHKYQKEQKRRIFSDNYADAYIRGRVR